MDSSRIKTNFASEWGGVLVRRNPPPFANNTHAGIAYRDHKTNRIRILHMGFTQFECEEADDSYLCAVPNLDPILAESFSDFCGRIYRANIGKRIPYDLLYGPYKAFDNAGKWIERSVGAGFNCSSFVVCVYESYQIPLIDLENWPPREDDAPAQAGIVKVLTSSSNLAKKDQGLMITPQIGKHPRIRPEEAAASAALYEKGKRANHTTCIPTGEKVIEKCDTHLASFLAGRAKPAKP